MAQIPTLTARRSLASPGVANTEVVPFEAREEQRVGAAIGNFGGAVTSAIKGVGGMAMQFAERAQKREDFKVENDYRTFQLRMGGELARSANESMPEGGIGFHDKFMAEVYKPQRDAFLKTVPDRLRERFSTLMADTSGSEFTEWSYKAAEQEQKAAYTWAKDTLGTTQNELANAISMNPEQYEDLLRSGNELIDRVPMVSPSEKAQLKRAWENMAQVAHLNRLMQDDPELVLKALGANPNMLTPTTQFEILSGAVQAQESGGNPLAVSEAGAVGTHQVMPDTAALIARRMGDKDFPVGENREARIAYLMRPGMSKKYGDYHLKWLMKRYPNDMEATLIAYHSGEGAADKWIKAGRDDRVLGPVGRRYYREVIARLPGGRDAAVPTGGAPAIGSAGDVKLTWVGRRGASGPMDANHAGLKNVNPDLVARTKTAFAAVGLDEIRIRSSYRDPDHNHAAGGAKGSQHLTGNALDIDVAGMTHEKRLQVIASLSAAGITGIGVYANTIHADLGGRRAWGFTYHRESVPAWAENAIKAHLAGKAQVPVGVQTAGRYSTMPFDTRQKFIEQADTALTQRMTAASRANVVERVQLQSLMDDEIAKVRATGAGTQGFDETRIATTLGEDDYVKWIEKRQEAQRTFVAVQGMNVMGPAELGERIEDFAPDPASPNFASQQRVHAAVVKEADRVERLRAKDPAKAAMEFPDVKSAYDKVEAGIAAGEPVAADVQAMVKLMLAKQKEFGVKADATAPIPSAWAFEIGQSLTRVPELTGRNMEDVRAAIAVQYNALQQYFGEYTDEVIIYALSEYKGLSENNAELITGYMQRIATGGDPFKPRQTDAEEVESASEPWFFERWFGGSDDTTEPSVPSPEVINRVINRLADTDDEALLVEQYGQAAVDAAKAQLKRQEQ